MSVCKVRSYSMASNTFLTSSDKSLNLDVFVNRIG
jgi:hypothetical protein